MSIRAIIAQSKLVVICEWEVLMNFEPRLMATLVLSAALGAAAQTASAQMEGKTVRIGVLTDESSIFSDGGGLGSVDAARMAIEDYGGKVAGAKIELLDADHLNKADVGSAIAREWFDQKGVDMITDLQNSAIALAVSDLARSKNKVAIVTGAAGLALTGAACSPNTVHWVWDTYGNANAVATPLVKQGLDKWFYIAADYSFGAELTQQASAIVEKNGGKNLGVVRHPLNTADFGSYLLQAQASGANMVALANGGQDNAQAIKQAHEFGVVGGKNKPSIVGLATTLGDIHALGLPTAQGLYVAEGFYWDLNDGTRAWSQRWSKRNKNRMPTMIQAGAYSATLHYLKAVEAAKSTDGKVAVEQMKKMPGEDALFGKGRVRQDGRYLHDMYLFVVKTPQESKGGWDYERLISTIPADQAFRPLDQGGCPLVTANTR
jgi:branched-chain amino acid transport system substrate-binding protein